MGEPFTVKNLDAYHAWPVKHRHWSFEVIEDESHRLWVNTHHLRLFHAAFPSDKELRSLHRSSLVYAKDVKTHYVAERTMAIELRKRKNHRDTSDLLRFLDWFERNVAQVAARKRRNTQLEEAHAQRLHHAQKQQSYGPTRVFHLEARPAPADWKPWAHEQALAFGSYLASFWRGERNLFLTLFVGLLVGRIPNWFLAVLLPASLDWTVSYRRVMWAFALVVPIALLCAVVFSVGMTRSTRRAWGLAGGKLWASTVYLLVIPLGPWIFLTHYDDEMLAYWWASVRGTYEPISVYADPHLGRIVVKGAMELGSAEALEKELDKNPRFTLVQLESPGGKVIEGLRMAQVVTAHKLDTVALEGCFSACTFVLAAGADRYIGPDAAIGFHRSGTRYGPVGDGWSETDHQIAQYYQDRGVDAGFIAKALTPSIRGIWVAPHADMLSAGYANRMWSQRKPGY